MKFISRAILSLLLLVCAQVQAFTVEITKGVDNPTKIAVVPFSWAGTGVLPQDVAAIVQNDLQFTGRFVRPKGGYLSTPHVASEVNYRDWRAIGAEYLVIGRIVPAAGPRPIRVEYALFDVFKQEMLLSEPVSGQSSQLRDLAHYISDKVFERLTGIRGAFSTRLLYVTVQKFARYNEYQLFHSDYDGERARVILTSKEPILSPTWSPDAREIAYVSFEGRRPAIYRQRLADGRREKLTGFRGLNGAPAWSPDGRRMAMTLSKDGNPEIYIMDLATKALTRVTNNPAIDTEPSWMPDGRSILFTSNRGGGPQIYQVMVGSGITNRLTFNGIYNARARAMPDGKGFIYVHQSGSTFNVALQNFSSGAPEVLSETPLDESPSVAPNAIMVMYATQRQGQGVLAVVSVDTRVKMLVPVNNRDVREPAWSPYIM